MTLNIRLRHILAIISFSLGVAGPADATDVAVCTDLGNFTVELFDEEAPAHAANFLTYVDRGFYTGTVFHRVISGFMAQGGGYTRQFRSKVTLDPVMNESKNGLRNDRGTLSAARTNDPHSATSQFYVNLENNTSLNASGDGWGYSVFGRVSDGMEVIDNLAALPTGGAGPFPTDVTDPLVAMTSMARVVEDRYPDRSADERHAALRDDIDSAVASGNNEDAAMHLGEYRAVCGELGADLLLAEARVLAAIGRNPHAIESLGEYLRVADTSSETYLEALSLSRELAPEAAIERTVTLQRLDELTADCDFPTAPVIPSAASATMETMITTQGSVRTYVEESTEVLECLEDIVDDDDYSEEDQELVVAAYNSEVAAQEALAARWNEQRELFMASQQ
jgi:cyclophilin family peptidyl-prolyl cis-trans isomerase